MRVRGHHFQAGTHAKTEFLVSCSTVRATPPCDAGNSGRSGLGARTFGAPRAPRALGAASPRTPVAPSDLGRIVHEQRLALGFLDSVDGYVALPLARQWLAPEPPVAARDVDASVWNPRLLSRALGLCEVEVCKGARKGVRCAYELSVPVLRLRPSRRAVWDCLGARVWSAAMPGVRAALAAGAAQSAEKWRGGGGPCVIVNAHNAGAAGLRGRTDAEVWIDVWDFRVEQVGNLFHPRSLHDDRRRRHQDHRLLGQQHEPGGGVADLLERSRAGELPDDQGELGREGALARHAGR